MSPPAPSTHPPFLPTDSPTLPFPVNFSPITPLLPPRLSPQTPRPPRQSHTTAVPQHTTGLRSHRISLVRKSHPGRHYRRLGHHIVQPEPHITPAPGTPPPPLPPKPFHFPLPSSPCFPLLFVVFSVYEIYIFDSVFSYFHGTSQPARHVCRVFRRLPRPGLPLHAYTPFFGLLNLQCLSHATPDP